MKAQSEPVDGTLERAHVLLVVRVVFVVAFYVDQQPAPVEADLCFETFAEPTQLSLVGGQGGLFAELLTAKGVQARVGVREREPVDQL